MDETAKFHVICHIFDPERRGTPHAAMMTLGTYVPSIEAAEWLETTGFEFQYDEVRSKYHTTELWFHFYNLMDATLFAMAFGLSVEDHDARA